MGIPRALAYLEDRIFENLPDEEALFWPTRFMKAIKPGADLKDVIGKFMVWMLVDKNDGVIKFAKTEQTKTAINDVADLYKRKLKGETITTEQWVKVRSDAAYAAYAAYAAAADADARKKHFSLMAEKLISLLKECE